MANIALRNPQFKKITIQASGTLSVVCEVSIDTVLRYTLIKNVEPSTTVNFDIAELARDYIEIEYQTDYIPQTVAIETVITPYDGLNGTGNALPLLAVTYNDVGFEAYGEFTDGVNPEVPFGRTLSTLLIPINEDTDEFTILAPNNQTGKIPYLTSSFRGADAYLSSDTSVTIQGVDCTIKRIDCTKYGDG